MDFHKLILTLSNLKIRSNDTTLYRTGIIRALIVRHFESVIFKKIEENKSMDFEAFKRTIVDILDKYAPLKKRPITLILLLKN